ncbi:MAG: hypothetical protein K0R57_2621 [Paenibacillaceae bacterium]|jgi:benzoyl-CoA reductase/2-hydroxyglutaryl-CoA dehydratase subunit BcrC/BadD/HgdB|nr:hypothetical protein [Paenibacillaceae bacterium]
MSVTAPQTTEELAKESQLDYIRHSRNVVHRHSPAVQRLFDLITSYVSYAKDQSELGSKVVWTGAAWAMPLVYASNIIPLGFSEMGRISGGEAVTIAEDYYQMPQETCSMVKASIGQWHLLAGQNTRITRIFSSSSMCDPFNLSWELLKKEGYDVFTTDVVYRANGMDEKLLEDTVQYFIAEINNAVRWFNDGKPLDEDRAREEIKRVNSIYRNIRRIVELRVDRPFYIRSLPILYLMNGMFHFFGRVKEYEQIVLDLVAELERTEVNEDDKKKAIPIFWSGGVGQEFGIFDTIDNANGALLGFLASSADREYDEDLPPVEAVARYLLTKAKAGATANTRSFMEQSIEQVRARGLILQGYLGCSFGSVARELNREYFHKKGLPSISLEGSFQVGPPSGQILTRIKAFIEMLS